MSLIRAQLNLFLIALGFLSRIPIPSNIDFSQENLNRASRYFPAVGWIIGGVCATAVWVFSYLFSIQIAIALSMLIGFLLTGCFHEDGLADTCDGLGGGWTVRQKLKIMKDSRVGTYGSVALWTALTIKFLALTQIDSVIIAIIIAHSLSRAVSTSLIIFLPYITDDDSSKVKPLAETSRLSDSIFAMVTGLISLLLIPEAALSIIIVLLIVLAISFSFLKKQLEGFTGDTLGAAQQVSEISIYLTFLALQNWSSGGVVG